MGVGVGVLSALSLTHRFASRRSHYVSLQEEMASARGQALPCGCECWHQLVRTGERLQPTITTSLLLFTLLRPCATLMVMAMMMMTPFTGCARGDAHGKCSLFPNRHQVSNLLHYARITQDKLPNIGKYLEKRAREDVRKNRVSYVVGKEGRGEGATQ